MFIQNREVLVDRVLYCFRITKTVHIKSASASASWRRATRDAASMGRNPTLNQSWDFLLWTRAIGRPRLCSARPTAVRLPRDFHWLVLNPGGGCGRGKSQWECSLFKIFFFLFLGGSVVVCVSRGARAAGNGWLAAVRLYSVMPDGRRTKKINYPKLVVFSEKRHPFKQ